MPPNDRADAGRIQVNALGMKCPWPVLRAARAMRDSAAIEILADDPIAAAELAGLARERGWAFRAVAADRFVLATLDQGLG